MRNINRDKGYSSINNNPWTLSVFPVYSATLFVLGGQATIGLY